MNRRGFLKVLSGAVAAAAAPGLLLPDSEEVKRFWPGFGPGTAKAAPPLWIAEAEKYGLEYPGKPGRGARERVAVLDEAADLQPWDVVMRLNSVQVWTGQRFIDLGYSAGALFQRSLAQFSALADYDARPKQIGVADPGVEQRARDLWAYGDKAARGLL